MSLSNEEIRHIAKLARLHIEEEEIEDYREKLESILEYVEKLQELNTDDVPELQHAADVSNVFRDDEIGGCDSAIRERIVDNFSNREGDLLKVQAVFENRTE